MLFYYSMVYFLMWWARDKEIWWAYKQIKEILLRKEEKKLKWAQKSRILYKPYYKAMQAYN